jgi:radical SAM protein with 4Fe4S-binding SPASM domain
MKRLVIRPVNALTAGFAYVKSSIAGTAVINAMPVSVGTELTNHCNLNCPECHSGAGLMTRERGFMDINLFDRILTELEPYLYYLILYFQGEPMMHPRFFSFLERSRNINTIVSTNGHFLSQKNAEKIVRSGLNKLIISIDGTDQETYSSYRINGNLTRVMDGISNLFEARKKASSPLKFEIQFLVNRKNEHQISSAKRLARKMNASLKLKSMQIINQEAVETWLPSKQEFVRYKKKEGIYLIKNRPPDRCARLWFNPVITWDGKVIPCCFDKNADHIMGDLNENSFRDIWEGPEYRTFRKKILSDRSAIEICRNCTSGLKGVRY